MNRSPMPPRSAPLASATPFQRGNGLSRRAPLRNRPREAAGQPQRRTRRDTGFSPKVKLQVRTRAGNGDPDDARCECCGIWLGRYGGQVQHIVARGMGGTSNPVLATAANGALLCGTAQSGDHGLAESRDAEMGAKGFWLPQGTDPRTVPMMLASEHGSGDQRVAVRGRPLPDRGAGSEGRLMSPLGLDARRPRRVARRRDRPGGTDRPGPGRRAATVTRWHRAVARAGAVVNRSPLLAHSPRRRRGRSPPAPTAEMGRRRPRGRGPCPGPASDEGEPLDNVETSRGWTSSHGRTSLVGATGTHPPRRRDY